MGMVPPLSVTGCVACPVGRACAPTPVRCCGTDAVWCAGAGALCWVDEDGPPAEGSTDSVTGVTVLSYEEAAAVPPLWAPPACMEATVTPPPNRANAVATPARRLLFFHRSICRRRAARPRC